jgi:hypothetical protein
MTRTFAALTLAAFAAVVVAQPKPAPRAPSAGEVVRPETAPKGPNLVANGDFEAGTDTPDHWQQVDGLTTFWEKDADPAHGKVLKIDTDVLQSQGYDWWTQIKSGKARAKDAPAKKPTVEPKYDTLAGLDGVWVWSDFIPVKKGRAYWLTMDVKGPAILSWLFGYPEKKDIDGTVQKAGLSPTAAEALRSAIRRGDVDEEKKILAGKLDAAEVERFVGQADDSFGSDAPAFLEAYDRLAFGREPDRKRGFKSYKYRYVWKGQMPAGGSTDEWRTYSRIKQPFRPTNNTPNVRYVRVMLYPFWPPDVYRVDNVRLVEISNGEDE